jgi:hypothetical protein
MSASGTITLEDFMAVVAAMKDFTPPPSEPLFKLGHARAYVHWYNARHPGRRIRKRNLTRYHIRQMMNLFFRGVLYA